MNKLAIVAKMLDEAIDELNAVIDPYAHLKEAHYRGEMVQHQSENGKWHNCIHSSGWAYNDEPDRYRIKPKTKTLYLFAYRDENTKSWKNTDIYHESIIDARADILWAVEFKRLTTPQ
jgi:hypothetical protein